MGVYKKNNRWYIDYYLPDGKRQRETVTIPGVDPSRITREDAKKALAIRKAELATGKFDVTQTRRPVLFDTFCDRYLNEYSKPNKRAWKRDVSTTTLLKSFFSGKTLSQITPWLVEKYKAKRQSDNSRYGRPYCKSSINRELACLKTMFNKAIRWGLVSSNPVSKVKMFKEKAGKTRVISDEEFGKIYNASNDFLKPILIIAICSGMRRIEIINLKKGDINLKLDYITVRESKNDESRVIPINDQLKRTLEAIINESPTEYLFDGERATLLARVEYQFFQAVGKSSVDKCTFHDLRHTFASRLVMAGVDIVTVKELLGHKDINMTMRYSHPTPDHKRRAVSGLNIGTMDTYTDTKTDKESHKSLKILSSA